MDPIAQMFTTIRNSQSAGKVTIKVPFSNIKMAVLEILKLKGIISDYRKLEKEIEIKLLSNKMLNLDRISRPGRRVYARNGNIPLSKSDRGIIIISTSEGIMSGEDARKKGLGGEIIGEASSEEKIL